MTTRILAAEDHRLVVDGYRAIFDAFDDLEMVGEVFDGNDVLAAVAASKPDVILLDLSLPGRSGLDLLPALSALPVLVVVVTAHADESYVQRALEQGAHGYVLKRDPARELVEAIRSVRRGAQYLSGSISRERLSGRRRKQDPYDALGEREREVLHYMARGKTTPQIAEQLGLSVSVIENYRRRARHKLGVRNHAELVQLMVRREALDPDLI